MQDFRSENGLYSLIQAQFDAAERLSRQNEQAHEQDESGDTQAPTPKRRRISRDSSAEPSIDVGVTEDEIEVRLGIDDADEERTGDTINVEGPEYEEPHGNGCKAVTDMPFVAPRTTRSCIAVAQDATSPFTSPSPEEFIKPLQFRQLSPHLTHEGVPQSSSPLSSPPPISLFDPYNRESFSEESPSRRSSTSPSELDDTPLSKPNTLSQRSGPSRSTLPNMKGKDLFDASIWADPTRTSVFYTFATTLRQKVKDVEPTPSHRFISHLRDRGKLVRCYTQNIDQIEEKVGLSTSLEDGPGRRGRFSRKSTANTHQLNKMVEEASSLGTDSSSLEMPLNKSEASQLSQGSQSNGDASFQSSGPASQVGAETDQSFPDAVKGPAKNPRREAPRSGVECVFLHGSLDLLRCFLCGRVCSWDADDREQETLSGQQPECPHCVGATTAREERGKRALGVGKLRPDIVLYGEEHPNAHLISPIVTHDLALCPDMLLILGTSLRVHGLKVMVREFAKAVHAKSGKVVFVNFTKPPESSWGDVIDYWIQWDCDSWVADLQERVPKLWQTPEPPKPKKKRESSGLTEDGDKTETKKPVAANPVALRDTKFVAAYQVPRILHNLHRITGHDGTELKTDMSIEATASAPVTPAKEPIAPEPTETIPSPKKKTTKLKEKPKGPLRRSRRSAPGMLERTKKPPSTLNPNHGRSRRNLEPVEATQPEPAEAIEPPTQAVTPEKEHINELVPFRSAMVDSIKQRIRKRKKRFGEEDEENIPPDTRRRTISQDMTHDAILLAPLSAERVSPISRCHHLSEPMEPMISPSPPLQPRFGPFLRRFRAVQATMSPPPSQPTSSVSPILLKAMPLTNEHSMEYNRGVWHSPTCKEEKNQREKDAADALLDLMSPPQPHAKDTYTAPQTRSSSVQTARPTVQTRREVREMELKRWGSRWNQNKRDRKY